MLELLTKYLLVAGLSAVKVLAGVALGAGSGLTAIENFIAVFVGSMIGIGIYTFFGQKIRVWNKHRRQSKADYGLKVQKNFRKARRIKRIWHKFGIVGIAFLTPPLLSPPLGTLIAVGFDETKTRIFLFMGVSVALWAGAFCFLGDNIMSLF